MIIVSYVQKYELIFRCQKSRGVLKIPGVTVDIVVVIIIITFDLLIRAVLCLTTKAH